ncbi:3-keto-disaccharide hydrolase [Zhouia amylolytica]|uniref:3-keto-alpha-glucoside-1,2-lyase/3-keto-2-hydroxy-glucal hydratase domain-containing protein n=1 Tax=Zhouia amylolytica AD3 TaxID=1286632 RepID=W2URC9_9FLAO|nr:DUF1080 domain-containing protein [Zhouia amylolytica]ETN96578.1 hypothetical protein P278_00040 [Zhouia amylolytica AD3]
MKKIVYTFIALSVMVACKSNGDEKSKDDATAEAGQQENKIVDQTQEDNWTYLFDGTSTDGWRGYNAETLPEGWVIEDGSLKSLGKGGDIGGDIVYGKEEFGEFELYLEWKIAKGGNSGIFYHVLEGEEFKAPYFSAPEYQVIDQIGFPQKLELWQSIGADYGMYNPDFEGAVKNAGEWNTSRIVFTNDKVSYYLNGKKTVEFVPWSEDWKIRKEKGKWEKFPNYGKAKTGLIGLQDHGSFIWYKNIKIKKL